MMMLILSVFVFPKSASHQACHSSCIIVKYPLATLCFCRCVALATFPDYQVSCCIANPKPPNLDACCSHMHACDEICQQDHGDLLRSLRSIFVWVAHWCSESSTPNSHGCSMQAADNMAEAMIDLVNLSKLAWKATQGSTESKTTKERMEQARSLRQPDGWAAAIAS